MDRAQLSELLPAWKPPAGLNRAWPREVELTGTGTFIMILSFLMVAGGLLLGLWLDSKARREDTQARILREQGADAQGVVSRLWRPGNDQYWVAFEFPIEGRMEARRTKVRSSVWKRLKAGDRVPVRYLPSQPAVSYIRGTEPRGMAAWGAWLTGGILCAIGALFPLIVRGERRLLAEGRVAPGMVTRLSRSQHGCVVHYEFALPGGGFGKGRSGPNHKPPAVGDVVPILYDAEHPRRNRLYPLSMVKLASY